MELKNCELTTITTYHSPLTTHHHSPLTTHHSPLTTHHSPSFTTHHSPLTIHFPDLYLITSAFSIVINPPDLDSSKSCSTVFIKRFIFSRVSTISTTTGRSVEISKSFAVWILLFGPKPIIPRVTVAPERDCFFASNTIAS